MIEVDLRFTRDGVPVLMHDRQVDRTTAGRGLVSALDWAELRGLDAGSWFGSQFADQRIPRLEEVFALAQDLDICLCIEAKGEPGEANALAALFAAREIARRGRLGRDVVASFDHAALVAAKVSVPGLRIAPDRLPERGPSTAADLIGQATAAGADIIQHHFADLDPDVVAAVQEHGIAVWAWPPANQAQARIAYQSGAIGLMGDDVAALTAVVAANGGIAQG